MPPRKKAKPKHKKRIPKPPSYPKHHMWTEAENQFLRENAPFMTDKELAINLNRINNGRTAPVTIRSVAEHRNQLNLIRPTTGKPIGILRPAQAGSSYDAELRQKQKRAAEDERLLALMKTLGVAAHRPPEQSAPAADEDCLSDLTSHPE